MKGACVSCSSSTVTLNFMVRRLLTHYVDEVRDVEGHFPDEDDDDLMEYDGDKACGEPVDGEGGGVTLQSPRVYTPKG